MTTESTLAEQAELEAQATPPAIGTYWPGQGGIYVGLAAADGDQPEGHLVLALDAPTKRMTWQEALDYAKTVQADGHELRLPTRFEAALIYANAQAHVDQGPWHWTGTQSSRDFAWAQGFVVGYQGVYGKDLELRVRLVRRFVL